MKSSEQRRVVVAISGASAPIYGVRLMETLTGRDDVQTHLIVSRGAEKTIPVETNRTVADVKALASVVYELEDIAASVSSGSFKTEGMVIAPCSMNTLSAVAHSRADNLMTRAADVTLKERRRLVLLVRETPLHLGHLRNMVSATELGAIILPPIPAFYHRPKSIDDIVDHTVGRVLDLFGLEHELVERWKGAGE